MFGRTCSRIGVLAILAVPGLLFADLPSPDILNVCNSGIPSSSCVGNPVTATVTSSSSSQIVLDVKPNSNFLLWDGGIFAFNWSGPAITVSFSGTTYGGGGVSITSGGAGNEDGFGSFTNTYNSATAGGLPTAGVTDLIVTITGSNISLADFVKNASGNYLAAHVATLPNTANTGFVTDGGGGGGGGSVTPEPVTFLLTGSALIAGALMKKRSLFGS